MDPGTDVAQIAEEIGARMIRLQAEYYDRAPEQARTYYTDDLVLVRLTEVFSKAEESLIERGDIVAVQHIRRRFQQNMAQDFKAIVEQATGREVVSFLSETAVEDKTSVEVFFLGEGMTDMGGFETA